jgi:DNA-directed RNA polymerase specialized sigma24 family protein
MREYQAGRFERVRRDLRVDCAGAAPLSAVAGARWAKADDLVQETFLQIASGRGTLTIRPIA